jgi:hypothetical protein
VELIHNMFPNLQRCNAQTKSSVRKYVKVLQILTSDQKKIIEDMGFEKLLEFKLTYQSIYLIQFLLDNTNPQTLVICVGGGDKLLPIHQNAVHCVLGVPTGSGDDIPHYDDESSELDKLKSELGLTKDSAIMYNMLIDKIKEGGTDELTIRCFFLVLFSTLLFPSTQIFITGRQAAMTRSTKDLKTVNWAKVIVDDIRAAVNKSRTRGSTRSSICCCTTFLTVCNHCYICTTVVLFVLCAQLYYLHTAVVFICSMHSCIIWTICTVCMLYPWIKAQEQLFMMIIWSKKL